MPLLPSSLTPDLSKQQSAPSVHTLPWPSQEVSKSCLGAVQGSVHGVLPASDTVSCVSAVLAWKRRRPQTLTYTTAPTARKHTGSRLVSTAPFASPGSDGLLTCLLGDLLWPPFPTCTALPSPRSPSWSAPALTAAVQRLHLLPKASAGGTDFSTCRGYAPLRQRHDAGLSKGLCSPALPRWPPPCWGLDICIMGICSTSLLRPCRES